MSTITTPDYSEMSLADLKAELAKWDVQLERSKHWNATAYDCLRSCRQRCASWVMQRESEQRGAAA